jgi:hypothetical protein
MALADGRSAAHRGSVPAMSHAVPAHLAASASVDALAIGATTSRRVGAVKRLSPPPGVAGGVPAPSGSVVYGRYEIALKNFWIACQLGAVAAPTAAPPSPPTTAPPAVLPVAAPTAAPPAAPIAPPVTARWPGVSPQAESRTEKAAVITARLRSRSILLSLATVADTPASHRPTTTRCKKLRCLGDRAATCRGFPHPS